MILHSATLIGLIQVIHWVSIKINIGKILLQFRLTLPNFAVSSFCLMICSRKGREAIMVIFQCSVFSKCIVSLVSVSCCTFKAETHLLANILEYKMQKMQMLRKKLCLPPPHQMLKCYYVPRGYIDLNYFCGLDRGTWKWIEHCQKIQWLTLNLDKRMLDAYHDRKKG